MGTVRRQHRLLRAERAAVHDQLSRRRSRCDALLAQLRVAGVVVDERIESSELGRCGWIMDPEGTRIELWQPPA
ncbi:MAG: VOC family protein [Rhodanobacter sp.]